MGEGLVTHTQRRGGLAPAPARQPRVRPPPKRGCSDPWRAWPRRSGMLLLELVLLAPPDGAAEGSRGQGRKAHSHLVSDSSGSVVCGGAEPGTARTAWDCSDCRRHGAQSSSLFGHGWSIACLLPVTRPCTFLGSALELLPACLCLVGSCLFILLYHRIRAVPTVNSLTISGKAFAHGPQASRGRLGEPLVSKVSLRSRV